MGKISKKVEEVVEEVVEVQNEDNVTFNEVGPNETRNRPHAETGFSLNEDDPEK